MVKINKHIKHLKSEKAKIKLKSKIKSSKLPKNTNVTDTSFKTKKILKPEQLKHHDETEIFSAYNLNIKDLLKLLCHHNKTLRKEALRKLKEIFLNHPLETLHSELGSLLHGIAALSIDKEKCVRKDSLSALNLILGHISKEKLIPYFDILTSYLNCAMTHINPFIRKDSLNFFNVLLRHCHNVFVKDNYKILYNFTNLLCELQNDNKYKKQLTTITNFKSTSIKWRIEVLGHLANMFNCLLSNQEFDGDLRIATTWQTVKYNRFVALYSGSLVKTYEINFNEDADLVTRTGGTSSLEDFIKYVEALMPVLFDIWYEVCPSEKLEINTKTTISHETSTLLKSVIRIIQSIIEFIERNHDDYNYEYAKHSFIDQFNKTYMKKFMTKFPYMEREITIKSSKCQEDYSEMESNCENCLEQNLGLCRIHVWFTSRINHNNREFHKTTKNYCLSVIKYLNDTIKNSRINDRFMLSQLTKLLRILFLSANSIWHTNDIDLSQTLQLIIKVSSRLSKNELQSDLSLIIGNILLECNLNELYREKAFKKYVATLPGLLLRPSIDEATIHMISQVALRFKQWIREELRIKRKAIIENAQKINIIGSHDDKKSRLMIYNLFYHLDTEIYF